MPQFPTTVGYRACSFGEALHLSEPTVRYYMSQILELLHLENPAQVIAYAARHGLGTSASS